ncbi:calcium transport inhibitor 2 precursor [Cavia porcellus]|nr:calcium transport inhibitor 2 precursor [Cavia porcellus]BAB70710.1 caltrin-like protein II [Cavia porcellus]BAD34464.1 calcium transport inhibitor caltrinII [Cavia porcellus]
MKATILFILFLFLILEKPSFGRRLHGQAINRPGSCPRVMIYCPARHPPNKCTSDYDCPKPQKCCPGYCGKQCYQPE